MTSATTRADTAAASVGATDLFVLRRVSGNRFVHFGGSGRGSGWAGLVEVTSDDEISLRETLESRKPVRLEHGGKELVFGPYYAKAAVFVPVSNDVVVVFGTNEAGINDPTDEALLSAAMLAADAIGAVTPAKQLADQLEELEAVRNVMAIAALGHPVEGFAREMALVAAEALSCELACVYLEDGDRMIVASRGWELQANLDEVKGAMRGVLSEGRFPYCVQDAAVVRLPTPLDREVGIRSYYLLELTGIWRGVLFIAHTDAAPRGFTLLCRRLGQRLAAVISARIGFVLTQEWCAAEAPRLQSEFAKLGV
ncbi:MAG TPA: hypothetical protein VGH52_07285 [Gaiellaceae bacterium]